MTADEIVALVHERDRLLARLTEVNEALRSISTPAPHVGEPVSTDRWREVHAHDKRMVANGAELEALRPWWPALAPGQLEVVELRAAGKFPSEIAQALGISLGAAHDRISNAKRRLARQKKLRPDGGPPPAPKNNIERQGNGFRFTKAAKGLRHAGTVRATEAEAEADRDAFLGVKPPPALAAPAPIVPPPSPVPPAPPPAVLESSAVAEPKRRTCRACGKKGHFAKTCPDAPVPEPVPEPVPAAGPDAAIPAPAPQEPPTPAPDVDAEDDVDAYADLPFVVDPTEHVNFVHYCARQFKVRPEDYEDIVGFGMIGLTKAAKRFDPARGCKFITFASWWIRAEIMRGFRTQKGMKAHQKEELPTTSIDAMLRQEVADENAVDPGEALDEAVVPGRLQEAMRALPARDRVILGKLFFEDKTLADVGREMGVSREWVRQIREKALKELREWIDPDDFASEAA